MTRKVVVSVILVVVLLGVGIGIQSALIWTAPEPARTQEARPAMTVRGVVIEPQTVVQPLIGYGTAAADQRVLISSEVSGQVVYRHPAMRVGGTVDHDEVLVRVDARDYEQQVARAQGAVDAAEAALRQVEVESRNLDDLIKIADTELEIAERDYARVLGLFENDRAPRRELDLARQGVEQARRSRRSLQNQKELLPEQRAVQAATLATRKAELELAKLNLERCTIRAPFGGKIDAVMVEVGERVLPGRQLMGLLDPRMIEIPLELPISTRSTVHAGAVCALQLEQQDDLIWHGRVARIAPRANDMTRTFALYVEVDNEDQTTPLVPGMFVRAIVSGELIRDALLVPREAIQDGSVFVCVDGRAERRAVELRDILLDQANVSGLAAGDVVATSNLDSLFDGTIVEAETTTIELPGDVRRLTDLNTELNGVAVQSSRARSADQSQL